MKNTIITILTIVFSILLGHVKSECETNQFQCDNGQCIAKRGRCNGILDCTDNSDETFIQCGSITCSKFSFRCNYGACIDSNLKCNGVTNCADGSDEDSGLCIDTTSSTTSTSITSTSSRPLHIPILPNFKFCFPPPKPQNGYWKLHKSYCCNGQDEICDDCEVPQNILFMPGQELIYVCNPGYKLSNNASTFCNIQGHWINIPQCKEIYCKELESESTSVVCMQNGKYVPCSNLVPGTEAILRCLDGYHREKDIGSIRTKCNKNGDWFPQPIQCIPAAHCVFEFDKLRDVSKLYILAGNIFRDYDSPFHDLRFVKKVEVKHIYYICQYNGYMGNFADNIAILEIKQRFVFSSVLSPICLDYSDRISLHDGFYGQVTGFGKTIYGSLSPILRKLEVPYVSFDQCKSLNTNNNIEQILTADMFCAGYTNGSAVCEGDSGSGLVFKSNGLWYLKGIVSVMLGKETLGGKKICNSYSYSLYTRVSNHMTWIASIISTVNNGESPLMYSCPL
ncbi:modular serine protease-like isoform X3 [Frieseomelitta varia]|uniref:modular serine protease-like isoform X3 n=1 Tax=Frieseomelitta varia TaxID=561572 RepID=UPI001CB6A9B0|nr:modular serine protease-like isoform X3 [Frieseomelitta varia]